MWWYYGHGLGHGAGWWGFALMLLGMVVLLCLLGGFLYVMLRAAERRDADRAERRTGTAEKVLLERYARGEMNEEEFERRRRVLHDGLSR